MTPTSSSTHTTEVRGTNTRFAKTWLLDKNNKPPDKFFSLPFFILYIYNGDNDVTMYFDGDEISVSQTKNGLNGAVLFPAGTNTKLIIGARYYGGNIYSDEFTGDVDDFKINNGLVATSASQAYNNQLGTSGFGDLGGVEDLTSTTTTTTLPECGIGSGCSLCSGWVTKDTSHTGCGEPYTECVRGDNGDGIYDQVCCGGTVNHVMML